MYDLHGTELQAQRLGVVPLPLAVADNSCLPLAVAGHSCLSCMAAGNGCLSYNTAVADTL